MNYVEINQVSIINIDRSNRLRSLKEEAVADLVRSMAVVGQMNPIWVTPIMGDNGVASGYRLVAGLHRVTAAERLGWTHVDARIVDRTEIEARKAEIAENLHRAELSVQERADHVAEWIKLTKAEKVSQVVTPAGGNQPNDQGIREAVRAGVVVNAMSGSRAVKIASITPAAREAADDAGLTSQKDRLFIANHADAEQVDAVAALVARKAAAKVKEVEEDDEEGWGSEGYRRAGRLIDEFFSVYHGLDGEEQMMLSEQIQGRL
jgi:hypothetical protein